MALTSTSKRPYREKGLPLPEEYQIGYRRNKGAWPMGEPGQQFSDMYMRARGAEHEVTEAAINCFIVKLF
ncbi:hypothetical protein [Escherichia coli]|uniref:hypothetical protein n=1 Tax=Escherichia coli TaxID=562 RepID=UPI0031F2EC47